ncbi:HK97 family phage prohead protease [Sphingobium xenophagum]|uniref:HK97 family phage prohead protease n=1 Tax=Sphingobium xenophagum TaxID=121428 RepID=A0A249MTM6_SPHXE|nr:HK97 family phage prohead protease [Sphingobium xenophagum]ASY44668.1 HK97 family phage prohead protease [Sphingobium xenophagum]EPR08415.1 peptidase U35 [Sphingobium indicum IP26]
MAAATLERRAFTELRTAGRRIEGYAATFGTEADLGAFRERIAPGAFRAAIAGDVLALLDHDAGKVLGRTRSGTLRLTEDSRGLAFSLDVPETQAGRDVLALAERGDLGGMSFGFNVPEGGESWDGRTRTLRSIALKEISVVSAWPAYPDTEIALRALQRGSDAQRRTRALALAEARQWA